MRFCFSELWYRDDNSDFDQKHMEVQFCISPNVIVSFLIRLGLRLLEKQVLHDSYSPAFEDGYFSPS